MTDRIEKRLRGQGLVGWVRCANRCGGDSSCSYCLGKGETLEFKTFELHPVQFAVCFEKDGITRIKSGPQVGPLPYDNYTPTVYKQDGRSFAMTRASIGNRAFEHRLYGRCMVVEFDGAMVLKLVPMDSDDPAEQAALAFFMD